MALAHAKMDLVRLAWDTLDALPENVLRPIYKRDDLSAGIVHIGLGNFHRAHQAWYLHRLMQDGLAQDWAIVGAGVRAPDAAQRERLLAQDCLTTLIELDPSGKSAEVIGPMIDFVPVQEGNAALIARMAAPDIRIVALTVTEGGYFTKPDGSFDVANPELQHDAANPRTPRTAFGAMIEALRIRREAGTGPFTGQSCDNLQGNGTILRQTIVSLAEMSDPDLAQWIDTQCTFPNAMVDCIVPTTGETEIGLARSFGIDDAAPVTHENFRQWVMEDNFCAGRPPWEKAGATLTPDVHSYEMMKIRVLNGGHQVIADAAEVLGIDTIAGAMADADIRALLRKVVTEEIAPHVAAVPGTSPFEYLDLVESRFSNPEIKDTTRRVAFDGSSRHPGFLLPSVREGLANDVPVSGLALVSAIWAHYCAGTRENGSRVEPNDPYWDSIHLVALEAKIRPAAWLEQTDIYGDLADHARFADAFGAWLAAINGVGLRATLHRYLAQNAPFV